MNDAPSTQSAIEFRDVSFRAIDGPVILDHLELAISPGESLVLLGRSGSGKTTALRLINRLLEPTGGAVIVAGRSTLDWDPVALRRGIGYVIQDAGLFPHYTVERNVGLVPWLDKWPEERRRARVAELLQLTGLDPAKFAHRYPPELSGGPAPARRRRRASPGGPADSLDGRAVRRVRSAYPRRTPEGICLCEKTSP